MTELGSTFAAFIDGCDSGGGGVNFTGGSSNVSYKSSGFEDCYLSPTSSKDAIHAVESMQELLLDIEENQVLSEDEKDRLIYQYDKCRKLYINDVGRLILEEDGGLPYSIEAIDSYKSYYSSLSDFRSKAMAYGLLVKTNQYENAELYLSEMSTSSLAEEYFILSQLIYLEYLNNINDFELSEENKQALHTMAQLDDPLSGFIYSIYYYLTGEKAI